MERIIKIQSDNAITQTLAPAQSGAAPNVPTQQLLDFRIPANTGVYDLSKSYISINMKCEDNAPAARGGGLGTEVAIVPVVRTAIGVISGGNDTLPQSIGANQSVMVRNCSMYSQAKGMIHSIRRIDSLNMAKRYLEKNDIELQRDLDINGVLQGHIAPNHFRSYLIDEVHSTGDGGAIGADGVGIRSVNKSRDFKIYLKELFGMGNAPAYSSNTYGETQIHLEMNFDKLRALVLQGGEGAEPKSNVDQTIADADTNGGAGFANGTTLNNLTMSTTYDEPDRDMPYFVGEEVSVVSTGSVSGAQAAKVCVIREIVYDEAFRKIKMTFNDAIFTSANGAGENVLGAVVTPVSNQALKITINQAELVLVNVMNPARVPSQIDYIDYSTEEFPGNGLTTLNKQTKLEGNAQTMYLLSCDTNDIAPEREFSGYRISIDNRDQTGNREVKYGQQLHKDRLIRAYRNKNTPLKNLSLMLMRTSAANANGPDRTQSLRAIVEPLELTDEEKNLQLQVNSAGGLQDLILYKELVKTI